MKTGKWIITFVLDDVLECQQTSVHLCEDGNVRMIARQFPGPFDSPDELLQLWMELIDHAEWHGEQLKLPVTSDE